MAWKPANWSDTGAPHLFRGCGIPARAGAGQPGWWVRAVSAAVGEGVEVGRPCSEVVGPVSFGDLGPSDGGGDAVSYTHLRAHETVLDLVCRLLLEKKKKTKP